MSWLGEDEKAVDIVHQRAAGMDVSKRDAIIAVRRPGKRKGTYVTEIKTFSATTKQVLGRERP